MKIRANLAIGGGLTLLSLFVGVFGPWLAHTDPIMDANLMNAELPPGAEFWFGTDQQGRDIFSRVMYGAQISLTVGIGSQLINTAIGTTLGVTAERDLVNQFASMPKVYDGACLAWLMLAGAATPVASPISGHLEFGWS